MNTNPPSLPAAPLPIPPGPERRKLVLEKMTQPPGLGVVIEALLKRPGSAVREFAEGGRMGMLVRSLVVITLGGLAVFGMAGVDFAKGIQWWATPLKMLGGLALSALICLPSLYIFACLAGLEIRFRTAAGLLLTALGLTGLLLAGFTPVVWVFSQSTGSIVFLGAILLTGWAVAVMLGMRLLTAGARALGMRDALHLRLWILMFLLVTLQMTCALRPLLGEADTFLPTEKKFFVEHWADQLHD
jgi:hypothetical protein